jgi:hypothetical protein
VARRARRLTQVTGDRERRMMHIDSPIIEFLAAVWVLASMSVGGWRTVGSEELGLRVRSIPDSTKWEKFERKKEAAVPSLPPGAASIIHAAQPYLIRPKSR